MGDELCCEGNAVMPVTEIRHRGTVPRDIIPLQSRFLISSENVPESTEDQAKHSAQKHVSCICRVTSPQPRAQHRTASLTLIRNLNAYQ
jgi:hypothetical protein